MIEKKPLISIIIPIYNAEHYLKATINSILSQNFSDYEIILLNDGSKDKSAQIAQNFAVNRKNITFVDKPNEGVAITRNKGIELSKGEFLMFVDADDILFPNTLSRVAKTLKGIDILRFEHQTINKNSEPLYPNRNLRLRRKYAYKILDTSTFMNKIMLNEYYMCLNIFRASLIKEHKISFLKGCTYNEDTLFIANTLQYSTKHIYLPITVYGYRKTDSAVTAHFTIKNYQDVKLVCKSIFDISEKMSKISLCKSFKSVAETLAITLYRKRSKMEVPPNDLDSLIKSCISHPILIEWKLIALLGKHGAKMWYIASLIKKYIKILQ